MVESLESRRVGDGEMGAARATSVVGMDPGDDDGMGGECGERVIMSWAALSNRSFTEDESAAKNQLINEEYKVSS